MIISEPLAQRIVDAATCAVPCNVNIMNRDGVIVGTAQPSRYRTVHKGAQDVLQSGAAVEIFPGEVPLFPGAREGVNLPIVLDDQIIGVVGVTGHPDEVRDIARLTKMITELILEREQLNQEARSRRHLAEHLMELLLWSGGPLPRGRIQRTAKVLEIDLERPRMVAAIDVSAMIAGFRSLYGDTDLILDRSTEAILDGLSDGGAFGRRIWR